MRAVVLGDGVTVVAYGGHGELHGGTYDTVEVGKQFPLRPTTLNDTFFLVVAGADEADRLEVFPHGCSAVDSDTAEALRTLPSSRRSRATAAAGAAREDPAWTDFE